MAENQTAKPKSRTKLIALVAVCIALILVAAFAGVYYLLPSNNKQTPSSEVIHNFSDGAWVNYAIASYYNNGTVKGQGVENSTITAGTYNETPCWIYAANITFTYNNGTVFHDLATSYYDKSTYATLQLSMARYANGELQYNETVSPNDEGFIDEFAYVNNLNITATRQSMSVPAGTFECTVREGPDPTEPDVSLAMWLSKDVPAWGEVKSAYSIDGQVFCTYTLESYGY